MLRRIPTRLSITVLTALLVAACDPKVGSVGAVEDTEGAGGTGRSSDSDSETGGTSGETDGRVTPPPAACDDSDLDGVPWSIDNAPAAYNPDQSDLDGDGVGDLADACPTVPGGAEDADGDGVGDVCDRCPEPMDAYAANSTELGVPAYMKVRNIPVNWDADGDGVGDACDNCPSVPNCQSYGPDNPHPLGVPVPTLGSPTCQVDADANGVGDACEGLMSPEAAGPVGLAALDDFDQDGLANEVDGCPRIPLGDRISCAVDADCPGGRTCELLPGGNGGVCDHDDADEDEVGDACDTCSTAPNPMQVIEGGTLDDDEDGDFVGSSCETSPQCGDDVDPRPSGLHQVVFEGACCVQLLREDEATGDLYLARSCPSSDSDPTECEPLRAPHPEDASRTLPVRSRRCSADDAGRTCMQLPARVAATPGILTPPSGCEGPLELAEMTALGNLLTASFEGTVECRLPQRDLDFDGLGDACDLCPFAFDPNNEPYIDVNGIVWPFDGRYCNGEYTPMCS